jgi:hypothetical protein
MLMIICLLAAMNGDHFYPLLPDESPMSAQNEVSPSPEKLARVHSPVQATRAQSGHPAAPPADRKTAMPPNEFAEKLMATNEKQQTNVQVLILNCFRKKYLAFPNQIIEKNKTNKKQTKKKAKKNPLFICQLR